MLYKNEEELKERISATCNASHDDYVDSYCCTIKASDLAVGVTSYYGGDATCITTTRSDVNSSICADQVSMTITDYIDNGVKKAIEESFDTIWTQGTTARDWWYHYPYEQRYIPSTSVSSFTISDQGTVNIGRRYLIKTDYCCVKVRKVNFKQKYWIKIN